MTDAAADAAAAPALKDPPSGIPKTPKAAGVEWHKTKSDDGAEGRFPLAVGSGDPTWASRWTLTGSRSKSGVCCAGIRSGNGVKKLSAAQNLKDIFYDF